MVRNFINEVKKSVMDNEFLLLSSKIYIIRTYN